MNTDKARQFFQILSVLTQNGTIEWDVSPSEISSHDGEIKILCQWSHKTKHGNFVIYQNSQKASTRNYWNDYNNTEESEPIGDASDSNDLREQLEKTFPFNMETISTDEINDLIYEKYNALSDGQMH